MGRFSLSSKSEDQLKPCNDCMILQDLTIKPLPFPLPNMTELCLGIKKDKQKLIKLDAKSFQNLFFDFASKSKKIIKIEDHLLFI